jgi:hypothetical protein
MHRKSCVSLNFGGSVIDADLTKGGAAPSGRRRLKARSSSALDRVNGRGAVLDAPGVQHGAVEIDLVPADFAHLGRPQAVLEGEKDHRAVAVGLSRSEPDSRRTREAEW